LGNFARPQTATTIGAVWLRFVPDRPQPGFP
jgi:hypothetical protein